MNAEPSPITDQPDAEQLLDAAIAAHEANQHATAEAAYRRVLEAVPGHPDALHLLGVLFHQLGRPLDALPLLESAVEADPHAVEFHNDLANVHLILGCYQEAEAACLRALELDPSYAPAHFNRGGAVMRLGRREEATDHFREALRLRADYFEASVALADLACEAGDVDEAMRQWRRQIELRPDHAPAHSNLGAMLLAHRPAEAVGYLQRAVELEGSSATALTHLNLGHALRQMGRYEDAIASYQASLIIENENAVAYSGMGISLEAIGRPREGLECHRRAAEFAPHDGRVLNNYGCCLMAGARFADARQQLKLAAELDPTYAEPSVNLGKALYQLGRASEAQEAFRQALNLEPDNRIAQSNLLLTLNYTEAEAVQVFDEHRTWGRRYARAADVASRNAPEPGRRLRVGYVSPDFREHSVAYFIEHILEAHDREAIEAICYSGVSAPDAVTHRLRSTVAGWRNTVGVEDADLAVMVRNDGIDILVDLAGHTSGNRLPMFARKPAPIQISYIGYPNTTGLEAMDYRIVDTVTDPPGEADRLCVEALVRLPGCFLSYRPIADAPPVADVNRVGPITFGSFNHFGKVSPHLLGLWARVMNAVPRSRLVLKAKALADAEACRGVIACLRGHGISADRVTLLPSVGSTLEHLACYEQVDIALDTYPYCGTTTTCEALWMGVPVVTLAGLTHVSRVGASLLTAAGLDDLIATGEAEYVDIATRLARDEVRRYGLRRNLRVMLSSQLTDGAAFARKLETAYRMMWERWCMAQGTR